METGGGMQRNSSPAPRLHSPFLSCWGPLRHDGIHMRTKCFFPSKVSNVYIKQEEPRERETERNEPTCARLCTIYVYFFIALFCLLKVFKSNGIMKSATPVYLVVIKAFQTIELLK